jgi:hypothetical protein
MFVICLLPSQVLELIPVSVAFISALEPSDLIFNYYLVAVQLIELQGISRHQLFI